MLEEAPGTIIASTLCCLSLLACNSISTHPLAGRTQGIGSESRLTSAERSAYVADAQYLRGLTRPDVPVQLNLGDPRQYNFAMMRLKLAGKDAKNSPYLFELIEARRQAQIASGLKIGAVVPALETTGAEPIAMHYIAAPNVGDSQTPSSQRASGTASSTFPGGTDYTYVDITISTIDGTSIAPLAYKEDFGNPDGNTGANVPISTVGDPTVSNLTSYTFESFKFEQVGDDFTDSYVHTEVGSLSPRDPIGLPQLSVLGVDAPADTFPLNAPDKIISVCMDRTWTNDCDVVLDTGALNKHRIKMPLKGAVKITTSHIFDRDKIQQLQTQLENNQTPSSDPGEVRLVLTQDGGGCKLVAGDDLTLKPGMLSFWKYVTLSSDNKVLSWDATGANAVFFAEGCTQIQLEARLTMRIIVPVLSPPPGNAAFTASFTITSDRDVLRPDKLLVPITLTNSCLAEGTQIQLDSGELAPIESLHIGQSVFNPYAGSDHSLTIQDTAQGGERAPMVRIRDEAGHALLMTEMHPIATLDRGMVQARALRTGDIVMTTQGPSKLIEVSREPYSGKVYNLKLGSQAEMASLGQDQTVVYANGFVVGDGQIQSKYEALSMKRGSKTVPERWRRDYLSAISRK